MNPIPLLFILVSVALAGRAEPKWEDYSTVVPALEKAGHAWMIQIDHETNQKAFVGIAVAVHNNEILFAEYQDSQESAHFFSPRGGRSITNDQFFLLQEDFMAIHRRYLQDLSKYLDANGNAKAFKDPKFKSECTPIMFEVDKQRFLPILDKPGDRRQNTVSKIIGTYFVDQDMAAYQKGDTRFIEYNFRKTFLADPNKADRTEFLCRTRHEY